MRTQVITSMEEFRHLAESWNRLFAESDHPELHDSWEWVTACLETMHGPEPSLFVIAAFDGDSCVGIAPLCIQKRRVGGVKVRSLRPINFGVAPYHSFLLHRSCNGRVLLKRIAETLAERRDDWDYAELPNFSSKTPLTFLLKQVLGERYPVYAAESAITSYVELPAMPKRNKNAIHNIERRERGLRKKHDVNIVPSAPYNAALWASMVEWNKGKWSDSRLKDPNYEKFCATLLPRLDRIGRLNFSYIEVDGNVAAIALDFRLGDKIYGEMINSSPVHGLSGSGLILTHRLLEYYGEQGIREYDFQEGDQEIKFYWTDAVRRNYHIYICNKTRKGAYLAFCTWLKVSARQSKRMIGWKKKIGSFLRSSPLQSRKEPEQNHVENRGYT
ncbi:GNAT family N-acetyltransferase [Paenibacillaceae bacterium WGS1546]|uniref:GNAT family N-acetyltransferase n=1 Tax=Cohnella sp. WGS1546 TaxID=3366810 RepID=UPI00372D0215